MLYFHVRMQIPFTVQPGAATNPVLYFQGVLYKRTGGSFSRKYLIQHLRQCLILFINTCAWNNLSLLFDLCWGPLKVINSRTLYIILPYIVVMTHCYWLVGMLLVEFQKKFLTVFRETWYKDGE